MKTLLLLLIRFYRRVLSPLKKPCCRYYPTCSAYALQAVKRFGAWHGTGLAVRRILRCNPWSPGGFDAVPLTLPQKRYRWTKIKLKYENRKGDASLPFCMTYSAPHLAGLCG